MLTFKEKNGNTIIVMLYMDSNKYQLAKLKRMRNGYSWILWKMNNNYCMTQEELEQILNKLKELNAEVK